MCVCMYAYCVCVVVCYLCVCIHTAKIRERKAICHEGYVGVERFVHVRICRYAYYVYVYIYTSRCHMRGTEVIVAVCYL